MVPTSPLLGGPSARVIKAGNKQENGRNRGTAAVDSVENAFDW